MNTFKMFEYKCNVMKKEINNLFDVSPSELESKLYKVSKHIDELADCYVAFENEIYEVKKQLPSSAESVYNKIKNINVVVEQIKYATFRHIGNFIIEGANQLDEIYEDVKNMQ